MIFTSAQCLVNVNYILMTCPSTGELLQELSQHRVMVDAALRTLSLLWQPLWLEQANDDLVKEQGNSL